MAKLFDQFERIVPTWLAAVTHLNGHGREGRNLVLEIPSPKVLTAEDRGVIAQVDSAIRSSSDLSVKTVAATIFPQSIYLRHGRPDFYDAYMAIMERAKKRGTWGTYALRMMRRQSPKTGEYIYPLEQIIKKLTRATTVGNPYQSNYELGVAPQAEEAEPEIVDGCELPLFNAERDGNCVANIPCLSHLSFKITAGNVLDLTAIYRSHYYCQRALGNLIGLSQLHNFVATESGMRVGMLTCVSTHAVLDLSSWGGNITAGRAVLNSLGAQSLAAAAGDLADDNP
jgi:hypothetical protein